MKTFALCFLFIVVICISGLTLIGCRGGENAGSEQAIAQTVGSDKPLLNNEFDSIAEGYVKLVLEIGLYAPSYVDAYYGPETWRPKPEVKELKIPHERLAGRALALSTRLARLKERGLDQELVQRHQFLSKQLDSIPHFIATLSGTSFDFDGEAVRLYDAKPPHFSAEHFEDIIAQIDTLVPGEKPLYQRVDVYRRQFLIPADKLDLVLRTAIEEARKRTKANITLPQDEDFLIEYVQDRPWSAYNWYKGEHKSLIQINTSLPIFIDAAVNLASHEGYPGHHVFNVLQETHLVEGKNWLEYSVYPLSSPNSLLSEGSADAGIAMVFPADEWESFDREILFPLAGLDPSEAHRYHKLKKLLAQLSYSRNEAARLYMSGEATDEAIIDWLQNYSLNSPVRAKHNLRFIKSSGSYVINYNLGADIVIDYIAKSANKDAEQTLAETEAQRRWRVFETLLSNPKTASYMR
ncbi:hypothetical protein ACVBIL_13265 [Shewanella sp. 125m-7]